jgi:hypothetical protein
MAMNAKLRIAGFFIVFSSPSCTLDGPDLSKQMDTTSMPADFAPPWWRNPSEFEKNRLSSKGTPLGETLEMCRLMDKRGRDVH